MKINPYMKKIAALSTVAAMTVSLAGCGSSVNTSAETDSQETDLLTQTAEKLLLTQTRSAETGKDETVYVIGDADGHTDQIIVNDHLKNGDGLDSLTDETDLTNIENTKGDETYVDNGDGTISWEAHGNDIFYRGEAQEELPLDVTISYELDGKKVNADQLEGAEGHLVMSFTYDNKLSKEVTLNGEEVTLCKPCVVVSGLMLDMDTASNVEVTNGKVLDDGDRTVAVGIAMPGMKENLTDENTDKELLDEIIDLIPESVTVEADVHDFSLLGTLSLASYDLALDNDREELDSKVDEVTGSADDLEDGMDKLMDGAEDLSDYMQTLSEGADTLSEGADSLADGAQTLSDGTGTLKDGTQALSDGAGTLADGTKDLSDGAGALADGTKEIKDGAQQLYDGSKDLSDGISTLFSSVQSLPSGTAQLLAGARAVSAALKSGDTSDVSKYGVYEAVTAMAQGADSLASVLQSIMTGADTISTQAMNLANGAMSGSSDPASYGIYEAAAALESGLASAVSGVKTSLGTAATSLEGANQYNAVVQSDLQKLQGTDLSEDQLALVADALTNIAYGMGTVSAVESGLASTDIDLTQVSAVISSIKSGAQQINAGAIALSRGARSHDTSSTDNYGIYEAASAAFAGAQQLSTSAAQLASSIELMTNEENMGALVSGLEELDSQSSELVDGISKLSEGATSLKDGASSLASGSATANDGAQSLANGAKDVDNGAQQVASGAKDLDSGAADLADGAGTLADGAQTLAGGASDLTEGASQLADGSDTLLDGINTLNDEGISKIVDLLGNKITDIYDRLSAVLDYGQENTDYTGKVKDTSCTVKYIYKSGEI